MIQPASNETLGARFGHLWHLIGNTPMLRLDYRFRGRPGSIYVKCEHYNLTGSIKDRMALHILHRAYTDGRIAPGDTIVEATSGNTGIAFAAIGRMLGHPVKIIMPDWLSRERAAIIRSMGAEVLQVSKAEGGFLGCIALSEEIARRGNTFLPRQFENRCNAEAHECTTMHEIGQQLDAIGLKPDAFVAGVGTGGTIMGAAGYFKKRDATIGVYPLEPAESPTLSTGYKAGTHRIQGISDEFIPAIVEFDKLDKVVQANDGDAIIMAQLLAQKLGLAVGISSGANAVGAIKLKEQLGPDATVVTVLSDCNKKYLSTDLVRDEPKREGYISIDTQFTGYEPIPRLAGQSRGAAGGMAMAYN
ncbi:PLP-dependent cysteine synthase family protein [Parapedobacter composti]|nr:cysteine synthase family protein [Parapedobacter composti]